MSLTDALLLIMLPAFTFLLGLKTWLKYGRDGRGKGLIIPQYRSPDELSPAEVGVLDDYESADREVTATIIDLTVRGYIKVHQVEGKSILGKRYTYTFELLRDDVLDLKEHEQKILDGLFGVYSAKLAARTQKSVTNKIAQQKIKSQYEAGRVSLVGKKVTLHDVQPYFYKRVMSMHESLYGSLTTAGYFPVNPLYRSIDMSITAFLLLVAAVVVQGSYGVTLCLSALPLVFFSILMRARSNKGQLTKEYIDGFRMYLKTAEQDRISSLQAPHSSEITGFTAVNLYEYFLPYAVALGLEHEWTKKFKSVYTEKPSWLNSISGSYDVAGVADIAGEVKVILASDTDSL